MTVINEYEVKDVQLVKDLGERIAPYSVILVGHNNEKLYWKNFYSYRDAERYQNKVVQRLFFGHKVSVE